MVPPTYGQDVISLELRSFSHGYGQITYHIVLVPKYRYWSEPLRVDKKLSNADSWREVHEEDQAALRPGLQDISISRT